MAEDSLISWTDHTFNPWMGCEKVSAGCKHCYAERLVTTRMGLPGLWGPKSYRQVTSQANWRKPIAWNRAALKRGEPFLVFSGSLCDVFDPHWVCEKARPQLWELIRQTPALDWLLLTKRAELIEPSLPADWGNGYENVWLGVSIESNKYAYRAGILRGIPAAVRFVSYEPALGPLDQLCLTGIDWVIYGGEACAEFREHDPQWARDMRDRCAAAGTAFFFKQSAALRTEMGTELDGVSYKAWPRRRQLRNSQSTSPDLTLL